MQEVYPKIVLIYWYMENIFCLKIFGYTLKEITKFYSPWVEKCFERCDFYVESTHTKSLASEPLIWNHENLINGKLKHRT